MDLRLHTVRGGIVLLDGRVVQCPKGRAGYVVGVGLV